MKIILDNGHGIDTKGKFSPLFSPEMAAKYGTDRFYEYEFNRDVVAQTYELLVAMGIDAHILVPEINDISIRERVRRANAIHAATPALLISVHANAAGNALKWYNATGCCVFYDDKTSSKNIERAKILAKSVAEYSGIKLRKFNPYGVDCGGAFPDTTYYSKGYGMVSDTHCPALLSENGFFDNLQECEFLMQPENRTKIAIAHAEAVRIMVNG